MVSNEKDSLETGNTANSSQHYYIEGKIIDHTILIETYEDLRDQGTFDEVMMKAFVPGSGMMEGDEYIYVEVADISKSPDKKEVRCFFFPGPGHDIIEDALRKDPNVNLQNAPLYGAQLKKDQGRLWLLSFSSYMPSDIFDVAAEKLSTLLPPGVINDEFGLTVQAGVGQRHFFINHQRALKPTSPRRDKI